ncbi:hypothetical protein BMG05_22385 [Mycobacterium malmoense]|nr:hypothetical protein BMG05_22385 [Mycobacterium malmoense]
MAARVFASLARNELVEVERSRLAALFASDKCLAQCAQPSLTIFKQPQSRTHDIAGGPVTARGDLLLDEGSVMVIEAE